MRESTSFVTQDAVRSQTWWLNLIRSEYREMPDLHLTQVQMQRLWGLGPVACAAVVDTLVAQKALRRTPAGAYAVARTMN
jgi:hypothetical protein